MVIRFLNYLKLRVQFEQISIIRFFKIMVNYGNSFPIIRIKKYN
jgi:hypothetical protein